jgi:hypothetical protein
MSSQIHFRRNRPYQFAVDFMHNPAERSRVSEQRFCQLKSAAAVPRVWGEELDDRGAQFEIVYWVGCAAGNLPLMEKRYRAVIAMHDEYRRQRGTELPIPWSGCLDVRAELYRVHGRLGRPWCERPGRATRRVP